MKTTISTHRRDLARAAIWIGVMLSIIAILAAGREAWWRSHPANAFMHYTAQSLPVEIHATQYDWRIDDNVFHVGHYWLLRGSPHDIAAFARAHGFVESTEDARWSVPRTEPLFGLALPAEHIRVGYERDIGRNDWIWVYDDGIAIYNEQ